MALFNRLKRINTNERLLNDILHTWSEYDDSISKITPQIQQGFVAFETDTGWAGLINLQEWFINVYPKIAVLTTQYLNMNKQYELFLSNEQAIVLPEREIYNLLKFNEFINVQLITEEKYNVGACLCISTPRGKLWITKLAEAHINDYRSNHSKQYIALESILFSIQLELGRSKISATLLANIKIGDILLIQSTGNLVRIDKKIIGKFQMTDEGIMVDLQNLNLDDESVEKTVDENIEIIEQGINYKALVPIKLAFILDKKELNLGELERIATGQIIPIRQDCYKNIELQANGLPIAKGEMIILDDHIAVEIKTIYGAENK